MQTDLTNSQSVVVVVVASSEMHRASVAVWVHMVFSSTSCTIIGAFVVTQESSPEQPVSQSVPSVRPSVCDNGAWHVALISRGTCAENNSRRHDTENY